jgi:alcohol dehydrogenase (cytochrome c)
MKKITVCFLVIVTLVSSLCATLISEQAFAQSGNSQNDWLTFNRTYGGDRYSPLKLITTANVKQLHLLYTFDLGNDVSSLQTGPVVVNGTMYFTTDTTTYAINAATGKLKWKSARPLKEQSQLRVNRGVAFYENKLFRGSGDAHLYALNATDGKQLWDVKLDVAGPGITTPMAPIAWNGMVFIGHAGGDNVGITGHVYALDANDGHVIWKFYVVPETGTVRESWTGEAKGIPASGGCFWTSFSLDTEKGILYVPSGNPAPDFDVEVREGDDLYTNSVIALDTKTGMMLGYIQLVRKDLHDWDVSTAPTLITTKAGRSIIASANKDGLLSVVDRSKVAVTNNPSDISESLHLIYAVPTTTRENMDIPLSREQFIHFKPGILGGSEWNGAAYHPGLDLIYVGAVDWGVSGKLLPPDSARMVPPPGGNWLGGAVIYDPVKEAKGWLTAFNAKDGTVRWKFKAPAPVLAGVTPTAGNLVFSADQNGGLYAFDAQTGKILWQTSTGLPTGGGIVSYSVNGKQYIAVAAGMKSPVWPGAAKKSRIMIYGL